MTEKKLAALRSIGNEWSKGSYHRIYINDLTGWYGLQTTRYGSGNISSATLDGQGISNSHAREICGDLAYGKLWLDLTDNRWYSKDLAQGYVDVILPRVREAVRQAVAAA